MGGYGRSGRPIETNLFCSSVAWDSTEGRDCSRSTVSAPRSLDFSPRGVQLPRENPLIVIVVYSAGIGPFPFERGERERKRERERYTRCRKRVTRYIDDTVRKQKQVEKIPEANKIMGLVRRNGLPRRRVRGNGTDVKKKKKFRSNDAIRYLAVSINSTGVLRHCERPSWSTVVERIEPSGSRW